MNQTRDTMVLGKGVCMKNDTIMIQAEAPREIGINKSEEDVWVEELSKPEDDENHYLPERNIVQTPNIK